LPPEFKSRFKLPTFFFDRPTPDEQAAIWPIYLREFNIPEQPLPPHDNWTGREIRACCENAWRLSCSLTEAATYVVPVAVSARQTIDRLRREASGCYISASTPGTFQYNDGAMQAAGARNLMVE